MAGRLRGRNLLRWGLRNPIAAVRLARFEWVRATLIVLDLLSPAVRRPVARTLRRASRRALRDDADRPLAAALWALATYAAAGAPAAREAIASMTPGTGHRARLRLASIALALDDPRLAEQALGGIDGMRTWSDGTRSSSVALDAVIGQMAMAAGRYSEAVLRLDSAVAAYPAHPRLAALADRARGEAALLDPAWRPELPAGPRLVTPRRGVVLHLLTNSLPQRQAGYTLRSQQVARSQQAVGLEPHMVTRAGFPGLEGGNRPARHEQVDGVPYYRIEPDRAPGGPADRAAAVTARGLARLVDDLRPAVLHPTSNHVNAQVALAIGDATGLPVVYAVRGFLEETWRSRVGMDALGGERYAGAREVETACMRRASAVVTLSETMRDEILARGGLDPERVVVVPNAVDVDRFRPGPRDAALAAALGIEPDEPVVGYISSLVGYEGIGYLVEAVAILRDRGCRARLLVVGDGDERDALLATADRHGLRRDGTAIFTGRVPHGEVERYYRTIDVFVVPRTDDRVSQLVTPLKPYEAMAMERALVVSDVAALREMVIEGETGLTFPAQDAAALADTIEPLLGDARRRRELGSAARAWVAEHRTWARNGELYLALYQRLGVA